MREHGAIIAGGLFHGIAKLDPGYGNPQGFDPTAAGNLIPIAGNGGPPRLFHPPPGLPVLHQPATDPAAAQLMNSDGLQAVAGPVVNLHAVAPHGHDQTLQALLDRLAQLEHYKNHLEHENRQMHQQLQVLSGFLNVVSTSVRTTENMLFPAPEISLEASQALNGPPPSAAQTPTAAARRKSTTVLDDSNIKRVKLEGAQAALATALNYIQHLSSNVSLRLTKVKGKSALHADPITIYRIELSRSGQFEKYLFLPNDAIPAYGVRSWQHREAIPQEVIKMVSSSFS